jgi:hypothetical protein
MRMRLIASLTTAALAAGAVLAAVGISGDGSAEPASSFQGRYVNETEARDLEPAPGPEPRLARKGEGSGTAIRHLVTKQTIAVPANDSHILRIICPRKLDPITGGVLGGPELAITNSSRVDPRTNQAGKRSWYIGVANLTSERQEFRGTIVCAKGL